MLRGYVISKVVPGHSSGGESKGPVVTRAVANAVGMCLLPDPLTTVILLLAPWSSASSVLLAWQDSGVCWTWVCGLEAWPN